MSVDDEIRRQRSLRNAIVTISVTFALVLVAIIATIALLAQNNIK